MYGTDPPGAEQARDIALSALARRDLSQAVLRERLHAAGIAPALTDETLDGLVRTGIVDDQRLADSRAIRFAEQGYGNDAIEARLDGEGFAPSVIRGALEALPREEERARTVARTLEANRIGSVLFRRGFGEASVEAVLARLDAASGSELP